MTDPRPLYRGGVMNVGILMSGSGSNAKKIIDRFLDDRDHDDVSFEPRVILTDNPDSNAVRIGTKDYVDRKFTLPVFVNSLKGFCKQEGVDGVTERVREKFDYIQLKVLNRFNIDCVVLAGYDWVVTPQICNLWENTVVNVHPGDLRVRYEDGKNKGKPKYRGLAWVPSAKAILSGEKKVHTSVHIVTPELDEGPILAVSAPQPLIDKILSLEDRTKLLGRAKSLKEVSDFIKDHPDIPKDTLYDFFPIYEHAVHCQDRLKEHGDWVIFPKVIKDISKGKYTVDGNHKVYFEGKYVPNGVEEQK